MQRFIRTHPKKRLPKTAHTNTVEGWLVKTVKSAFSDAPKTLIFHLIYVLILVNGMSFFKANDAVPETITSDLFFTVALSSFIGIVLLLLTQWLSLLPVVLLAENNFMYSKVKSNQLIYPAFVFALPWAITFSFYMLHKLLLIVVILLLMFVTIYVSTSKRFKLSVLNKSLTLLFTIKPLISLFLAVLYRNSSEANIFSELIGVAIVDIILSVIVFSILMNNKRKNMSYLIVVIFSLFILIYVYLPEYSNYNPLQNSTGIGLSIISNSYKSVEIEPKEGVNISHLQSIFPKATLTSDRSKMEVFHFISLDDYHILKQNKYDAPVRISKDMVTILHPSNTMSKQHKPESHDIRNFQP